MVGYAPYVKNTITKGHPFYPLFGKEKIDIITSNQPYDFQEKGTIEKFMTSMFAKCSNIHLERRR